VNHILRTEGREVTVSLGGISEGRVGEHGVKARWAHVKWHADIPRMLAVTKTMNKLVVLFDVELPNTG